VKIQDLDAFRYQELIHFWGFETQITPNQFEAVVNSRPGSKPNVPSVSDWLPIEHEEFEKEVRSMSQYFAYG
ncbi:hypothetical protein, partial [Leptolyngbya ectocarpi]|uniref:hypothetical protein n=1 Tax=Leptolyngbya ectocarpi TaxID=1202 RepID=UPI001D138FCC